MRGPQAEWPVEWAHVLIHDVRYDQARDYFVAWDAQGKCLGTVDRLALNQISGMYLWERPGRFNQTTEQAAIRYFQHELFLAALKPATTEA